MERLVQPDSAAFGRRSFLKGATGLTGALLSLSGFGKVMSEAFAQDTALEIPKEARNVEAALAGFVSKWEFAGPAILLTRFGRFLSNRIFNCHVAGSPRAYHLILGGAGATLNPGTNPFAHANLVMNEESWNGVLYGDFTGLAPILAGEMFPTRDEANRATLLAIVMFVFAHIPAGGKNDPQFTARVIGDLIERQGLPACSGEPSTLEVFDDLGADPQGGVEELVLGADRAPEVTKILAEWVHGLDYGQIPAAEIQVAKDQLKSILGVAYAGLTMEPGMRLRDAVQAFDDKKEATVIGGAGARFRTSARHAAMANSFLAQILEWEDWTFLTHSGAAIVPVALAAGEVGHASGRDVLAAIVAANEILARAGEFLTDVIHTGNAQSVHQLELPLVAAKLLGLDAARMRDASGIACTQPQVTSIASWTADAKGMLTGAPAQTAVLAAELARAGLSGRRDLLENPLGYFYRVADVGSPRRLERAVKDLGSDWRFARQYFNKRYPTDGFQLPAVHAMLDVRSQILAANPTLDPADLPGAVERIFVRIPLVMAASATMFGKGKQALLDRVLDPAEPDWTYIALLFDGPYPLVAALLDGELTQRQYRTAAIGKVKASELYERVEMVPDLSMGVFGAEVTVTVGATEHESFVACIREDTGNGFVNVNDGFSADDKFHLTAAEALPSFADRQAILDAIDDLESFTDIGDFTAKL